MMGGAHLRGVPSGARRATALLPVAPLLAALLLAAPGCPRPAAPSAPAKPHADLGPPDAFGVRAGPDHVLVPRAALVHDALAPSFLVVDGAVHLRRDRMGLLGAMGVRRGDTLRACAGAPVPDVVAVDACLARFYTDAEVTLSLERNAAPRDVRVVFDGPSIPAPGHALASLDAQSPPDVTRPPAPTDLAAAYGLVRAGNEARMPRGALVRLVDDKVFVRPLREDGAIVAYAVESPVLAPLGWTGATTRVDELALTSDDAVTDALRRLFAADQVVVTPLDGGPPLTIALDGAPTAPPARWAPSVLVEPPEARIRAGVRIDGEHRYVPRTALTSLDGVARDDTPRAGAHVADAAGPVTAYRAFGPSVADLLDLAWDAPLERIDGVPLYGATSLTELRRRLLTGGDVALELGGASPQRVVVHVEGAPFTLPEGWPTPRRGTPGLEPDPFDADFVRDGETVRTSRLVLRSLFVDPFTGRPTRDGLRLGPNMVWSALDVPPGTVLMSVDDLPATDPTVLDNLALRLCTSPVVTLTLRDRGGANFTRVVYIDGPQVTPP